MITERRNLYRLLHVQPEAPGEVITAVYRCLMSKLKMHPDLGGNHEVAARINDAYAILSDPEKRKAYDEARKQMVRDQRSQRDQKDQRDWGATQFTAATEHAEYAEPDFEASPFDTQRMYASGAPERNQCPMCSRSLPRFIGNDTHCEHCGSPLSPVAHQLNGQREAVGRRTDRRIARSDDASLQVTAHLPFVPARLRDMSLSGICLMTKEPVQADSVVRIMTDNMDLVAHVIKVRQVNGLNVLHSRLLTGRFGKKKGVFVSATV